MVEHRRAARPLRCQSPQARLPQNLSFRAGEVHVHRGRPQVRGGLRPDGRGNVLAPAGRCGGGVRRTLGKMVGRRGKLGKVLRLGRGAQGFRRRQCLEGFLARRRGRGRRIRQAQSRRRRKRGPGPGRLRTRPEVDRSRSSRWATDAAHKATSLSRTRRGRHEAAPVFSRRCLRKGPLVEETYRLFVGWKDETSVEDNLRRGFAGQFPTLARGKEVRLAREANWRPL
jgi:hypothetical protein